MNLPTTVPFVSKVASSFQGAAKDIGNFAGRAARGAVSAGKAFVKAEMGNDSFTQKVSREAAARKGK